MKRIVFPALCVIFSVFLAVGEDHPEKRPPVPEEGREFQRKRPNAENPERRMRPERRMEGDRAGQNPREGRRPSGPPRGPEHGDRMFDALLKNPGLAEKIGISEKQIQDIKTQREAAHEEITRLREKMETVARRQAKLLSSDEVDEKELMAEVERAGELHTKMAKLHMQNLLETRRLLSADQRESIRKLMQKKMQERRERAEKMREMMNERGTNRPEGEFDRPSREQMMKRREEFRKRRAEDGPGPAEQD